MTDYVLEIKANEEMKISALERDSAAISNEIQRLEGMRRNLHYEILKAKWLIGNSETVIQEGTLNGL